MRRLAPALCLAWTLGCGHSEPFGGGPQRSDEPFAAGAPVRLTYNLGADEWAAWTADGLQVYYSAQDSFRVDPDQCVVRMPGTGGTRTAVACPHLQSPNDTTEILDQPAPLGDRLAYASQSLGVTQHSPFTHAIWVADNTPFAPPRKVMDFPYDAPSGKPHDAPLYLQWLRSSVLLYLGAENGCCRKDTLRFGEQVVLLDLAVAPPARTFVPGTGRASAVRASEDGTAIYYTFYGDSIVWSQDLASGSVAILHNFGSGHIVRDPAVAQGRLVAVVDGKPQYGFVPAFGMVSVDYGGVLVLVDLATGSETWLPDHGLMYKRPVFAPDGSRFVAEGFPYVLAGIPLDTVVSKWADLYLFEE